MATEAGAELELEESVSVRLNITLPRELEQRLRAIADSRGIGVSTLIRMICYASLESSSS